ncbi:hypothetical protein DPX16_21285 [Anabarilius grahami]|uniref:Uncharacterized protein n=1 Tax=Anabarilius grahami TaxID=495550 RepID=A0A3N0Y057_ANAGA|nr:hypothetical protein DPX16_21285 [Anabarilius grahami]
MGAKVTVSVINKTSDTWHFTTQSNKIITVSGGCTTSYQEDYNRNCNIRFRHESQSNESLTYTFDTTQRINWYNITFIIRETKDHSQIELHCTNDGGSLYCPNYGNTVAAIIGLADELVGKFEKVVSLSASLRLTGMTMTFLFDVMASCASASLAVVCVRSCCVFGTHLSACCSARLRKGLRADGSTSGSFLSINAAASMTFHSLLISAFEIGRAWKNP